MSYTRAPFRRLIEARNAVAAPGVYDALSAKIAAAQGFEALYVGGNATCATRLGQSDMGLMTMPEVAENAMRIVDATGLPVVADADTGYGNPLNVQRTVKVFEKAGISAIHLEDQMTPKRCGHFTGKQLIEPAEMVQKIKAALDARTDSDFMIIARTDAISVDGFSAALERAQHYEEAGADMLFFAPPVTEDQARAMPARFAAPLVYHCDSSGRTPIFSKYEAGKLGYGLTIYPTASILSVIPALSLLFKEIRESGMLREVGTLASFQDLDEILERGELNTRQEKYSV